MEWFGKARDWAAAARGRLYAAPATPFDSAGRARPEFAESYFRALVEGGADGLAIAAHTGRGPHLSARVRAELIGVARRVGAATVAGIANADEVRPAAEAGAEAVLVFPVPGDAGSVRRHLDLLWEAGGLPLVGFDLYTAPYSDEAFAAVVGHPAVAAVKLALLSDAIACQDRIALVREHGKLAVTGEDRMFGASLTWGAEAALVGVAAAAVGVTRAVLDTFTGNDLPAFLEATRRLDALAATTFREPMDGYVQRMAWIAGAEGLLPTELLTDPYAPALPDDEQARVLAVHRSVTADQSPVRTS
ncbi:dihydrodipicolinate synthase family protein [Nocardia sp. NBC_01329]|uniref:dihydrodipicolinate synthase family protein n=1 Tax=Nocardia sp. NBC_01329 TaxID=2903594 RepID=UPI002E121D36|nr:dihydrodipicolinate synthase family protein [Nocardia sp. NBC_01329]